MHSTISMKGKAATVTPTGRYQWFLLQNTGRNLASGPQLSPLFYRSPLGWHYFISSSISSGPFSNLPFSSYRGFFPGVRVSANEKSPNPSGKPNRSASMTRPRLLFSDKSVCAPNPISAYSLHFLSSLRQIFICFNSQNDILGQKNWRYLSVLAAPIVRWII